MENNNYSLADIATAAGGETGMFGGSGGMWIFALLILLLIGNGNGGLFGNGASQAATAATTADIQRAVDLNSIQTGQANISADIQRGIYEINGATKDAAYNNLSEIRDVQAAVSANGANVINNLTGLQATVQNCCCETKGLIMENRYLDEKNASAIMMNDTANTQKVIDAINQSKVESLQSQINNLQMQQALCGVPKISPYSYGVVPNWPFANVQ